MTTDNIQVNLTLTQQMTLSKLQTRLDALKVERDEILQEITEFIQMSTVELGIPRGATFDRKAMAFIIPQAKEQNPEGQGK